MVDDLQNLNESLLAYNEISQAHGLILTEDDVKELAVMRDNALRSTGRIELGGGIMKKLVEAFSDSPYLTNDNFVEVLGDLQDSFYYYKNESLDTIPDDDLIEYMKDIFNGKAGGDIDYLLGTSLEELCREKRYGTSEF